MKLLQSLSFYSIMIFFLTSYKTPEAPVLALDSKKSAGNACGMFYVIDNNTSAATIESVTFIPTTVAGQNEEHSTPVGPGSMYQSWMGEIPVNSYHVIVETSGTFGSVTVDHPGFFDCANYERRGNTYDFYTGLVGCVETLRISLESFNCP